MNRFKWLSLVTLLGMSQATAPTPSPSDAAYAYASPAFKALTQDSYTLRDLTSPDFPSWLEGKYAAAKLPLAGGKTLLSGLAARKAAIAAASGESATSSPRTPPSGRTASSRRFCPISAWSAATSSPTRSRPGSASACCKRC